MFARLDAQLELLGPAWYDALGLALRQGRVGGAGPLRRPARAAAVGPGPADPVPDPPLPRRLARRPRPTAARPPPAKSCSCGERRHRLRRARRRHRRRGRTGPGPDRADRGPRRADREPLRRRPTRTAIIASAPGVGPVIAAVIAGRIGDPHRFTSLAAIRALLRAGAQGQPVRPLRQRTAIDQGRRRRCCAKRCSQPPTTPARPTPSSPRNMSG